MRQPNYPTQGMERAQPVLGHQPPLPGAAVVRYIHTDEEHHDGAMVPVNYYGEDENEQLSQQASVSMYPQETPTFVPEGQYQMDHNTLWFIANGMARPTGPQGPRPYKSGPSPAAPPGPCYNCGENHWIRDCPYPRKDRPQATGVQPLARFCIDCGIKHLVQDCPMHPDKKGKTSLNYVTTIPSTSTPSSSESDRVVSQY